MHYLFFTPEMVNVVKNMYSTIFLLEKGPIDIKAISGLQIFFFNTPITFIILMVLTGMR